MVYTLQLRYVISAFYLKLIIKSMHPNKPNNISKNTLIHVFRLSVRKCPKYVVLKPKFAQKIYCFTYFG